MELRRRGFLLGLLAAPAIVRASSLMSVKPLAAILEDDPILGTATRYTRLPLPWAPLSEGVGPLSDLIRIEKEVLPLIQRRLVAHQFGRKITIPRMV